MYVEIEVWMIFIKIKYTEADVNIFQILMIA